ncbi:MAG: VOC family protein [Acidimicrobiales bacterium]|nr:VOC family protein [Acidimicrobiales bacterium]
MSASLNLNAVTLGVEDIARSAAFYQLLGWTLSARSAPHIAILTTPPSAVLILHEREDLVSSASIQGAPGFGGVVLTMAVASSEAVHRTLAEAIDSGASILRPVTQLGGYGCHAFLADPDGHVWEVIETPGFEVDDAGGLSVP